MSGSALAAKPPNGGAGTVGWSAGTAISAVEQPDPTRGSQGNDVAVNASGLALAAWDRFSYAGGGGASIGAAVETAGRWSAPFTVSSRSTGFSMGPRVAVAATGALAVSWTWQDATSTAIEVAIRPAGSAAWSVKTLATGAVGGVQGLPLFAPLAFDGDGNLTAAWTLWDGSIHRVQSATIPRGATWSAPADVMPGFDGIYPALAVNARGDAAVVASTSPYTANGGSQVRFVSRSGGAWSTPVIVSETIPSTIGYVSSPMVALDRDGLATVAYIGHGLEATRQLSATTWTSPVLVIDPGIFGASFLSPDLGMDASGNAVATVSVFDPTIGVDRASVWVSRGSAAGAWSPQLRITDPAVPVDAYATRAAVSLDGGLALVGWIDHYHGIVQAARFDAGAGKWVTSTVGKGTAFSSFQEVLSLDAASATAARAIWKNARMGTQTLASDYRP